MAESTHMKSAPQSHKDRRVLIREVPRDVMCGAEELGLHEEEVLFSVPSDLDHHGEVIYAWLVVTKTHAAVFREENHDSRPIAGPYELRKVEKVRLLQTVGSAFLQFRIDGVYLDVTRLSNGYREIFGRAVTELKRMIAGEEPQLENLNRDSETICKDCSMTLPAPKAPCPRCTKKGSIFSRTLKLMQPYFGSILMLLGAMIMGVLLDLMPPALMKVLMDEVLTPRKNMHWLPWVLGALVAAALLRMVVNIFLGRRSSFVGTRITKELRERVQHKLLGLSVDYYTRNSAGGLMSRVMGDVEFFQSFVQQVAQGFLLNVLMVVGIGAALFYNNAKLATWVLLPIPFVFIGTSIYWKVIYPRYYRVWDSQSKMSQQLHGLLQGVRLVKAFGQEQRERDRFAKSASYMQDAKRSLEMSAATFNPIMGFVFSLGGLIVWNVGGRDVLDGEITVGTLMAFFGYLGMFYGPIQALSNFSTWLTGFIAAGQRVFEVLESTNQLEEDERALSMPSMKGRIELKNVVFGYDPYSPVLKGINMTIDVGQFVGIVGKSGSGKSTISNLICRFYDPQEGEVLIDGINVKEVKTTDVHKHIGLVLQDPFLFRASIAENIAYGRPQAPPMAIVDAAKTANAHDFIAKRNAGYDTKLGENGAGLSGGERQRISIARALLCNPTILILDEATSAVDTESEQMLQTALAKICKGRTTIAIAHRLSTLKNADVIYVIDEGKVAETGSHEQLMEHNGIYAKMVKIQTELTKIEGM
ncbi:MAG: ABC transporter ATP-binding protein [Verrucomicrobiaceae bacterium]|nr:ABC transporter ATP-binding protein [Verrucomicrobiaceae bacterium]